jgi:hypothetical protein
MSMSRCKEEEEERGVVKYKGRVVEDEDGGLNGNEEGGEGEMLSSAESGHSNSKSRFFIFNSALANPFAHIKKKSRSDKKDLETTAGCNYRPVTFVFSSTASPGHFHGLNIIIYPPPRITPTTIINTAPTTPSMHAYSPDAPMRMAKEEQDRTHDASSASAGAGEKDGEMGRDGEAEDKIAL